MSSKEIFLENVKLLLVQKGLKQQDLNKVFNDTTLFTRLKRKDFELKNSTKAGIATALGTTVEWLEKKHVLVDIDSTETLALSDINTLREQVSALAEAVQHIASTLDEMHKTAVTKTVEPNPPKGGARQRRLEHRHALL